MESGVAGAIHAGHGFQGDGRTIGKDDAIPGNQDAGLAVDDPGVINAIETSPLRDEEITAVSRVVDVLAHLGDNLAREFGVDAADHPAESRLRF
jgi:hypothetical protein